MKRRFFFLFLMFSILSSYATIIDLTDGYKIEGEIVAVQSNEISLVHDNLLLLISRSVIEKIQTDDKIETIPDLSLREYPDIDYSKYDSLIKVEEGFYKYRTIFSLLIKPDPFEKFYPSGNYLKLKTGEEIYDNFTLNNSAWVNPHIILEDQTRIDFYELECYQYEYDYFQNIPSFFNKGKLAKRIIKGKIDLFSITSTNSTPENFTNMNSIGFSYPTRNDYFEKDDGVLNKVNYKNLKVALADNSESMKYLSEYKTLTTIQWGLCFTGIGLMVGGAIMMHDDDNMNSEGIPIMIIGSVVNMSCIIPYFNKSEKIEEAIEAYNH